MIGTEMHAHRVPAEAVRGQRRDEVLRRMLLRVISTAESVHGAVNGPEQNRGIHDVHNAVILVDYVDHMRSAEQAGVVRLPAGGRVEGGSVKYHVSGVACVLDRDRVEIEQP
jgi:hypothetical protein